MTAALQGELVDFAPFFAPASTDMVDGLVSQYNQAKARIEDIAALMQGERMSVFNYFVDGNQSERERWYGIERLFNLDGAIGALNADFWNRALKLTDVWDVMPQARRDEWHAQIRNPLGVKKERYRFDEVQSEEWHVPPLPPFEEETVRNTLADLLAARARFFAERVDGIFRGLSRTHVTNRPEGFQKRAILAGALDQWGSPQYRTAGLINDLRCVIARFMGRDEPKADATGPVLKAASRHPGKWMAIDGGALRIRVYTGVGTAHLEVHPDMAWRLNCVLASLYPAAIPSEFRTKPKKKLKDFSLMERPLPAAVMDLLARMEDGKRLDKSGNSPQWIRVRNSRQLVYRYSDIDKATREEAIRVLEAIGATQDGDLFLFDYDPTEVLDEIICSGCIPDQRSHQFYPTPADLAEEAVALAQIGEGQRCLEPSAGQGGLAGFMPAGQTTCVEVNPLNCKVLAAKGLQPVEADFLKWSAPAAFDRVVMNPPFSQGRWQAHLEHAASMLAPGGRLVAILPSSAKGKDLLPGFDVTFKGPYENRFVGTSISVVLLVADRPDV